MEKIHKENAPVKAKQFVIARSKKDRPKMRCKEVVKKTCWEEGQKELMHRTDLNQHLVFNVNSSLLQEKKQVVPGK